MPRRVVIACTSGRTIIGTLAWSWPWSYRVRSAKIIERGVSAREVDAMKASDGVVCVPRTSIDYVQIV